MSEWWPKDAATLNKIYPAPLARAIHFPTMLFFVFFIAVHVFLVFATGLRQNLGYMFAGTNVLGWAGVIWFIVAMAVVVAGWFAARPLGRSLRSPTSSGASRAGRPGSVSGGQHTARSRPSQARSGRCDSRRVRLGRPVLSRAGRGRLRSDGSGGAAAVRCVPSRSATMPGAHRAGVLVQFVTRSTNSATASSS